MDTNESGRPMRDLHPPSPSVVVGIDGSRTAVTAALWAVDEAVKRDIPLRLVYAIEPLDAPTTSEDAAHGLGTAEIAVRHALNAVEATDKPVKVEVEILQGLAADMLLLGSHSAAMLCIGARGVTHPTAGRAGSTAADLASRAQCAVAIIRGYDPAPATPGAVVVEVEVHSSPDDDAVLQRGIDEALLRSAPLVVVSKWHPHVTDVHDCPAMAEQDRLVELELNRRLEGFRRRHPGLDARAVSVHGSLLTHVSHHVNSTQLIVVGRRRTHGIAEMVGPPSDVVLHDTDCSVLICDPRNPF
jgi:nucleotide-binding universal stress UspA family protein